MSTCPLDTSITTNDFTGIWNCFTITGYLDMAGLWATSSGAWWSWTNYTVNVPIWNLSTGA